MSKKLYLSFLWHMHQPYYKDDCSNTTLMPWVFLHAIKDYYDIPWYMEQFPNIKATFNLVPSLMAQIEEYINGNANDKFMEILKKDVNHITKEEELFLEEYLFLANEYHMVRPLPRYNELLLKFRAEGNSLSSFSKEELIELQVLFLLAWCGNFVRDNNQIVKTLLEQKRGFSSNQKLELINTLFDFLKEVIPFYKKLSDSGQISISTTPFYHPILPLLLDRHSAVEAKPHVILPNSTPADFKDFASMQVKSAVEYYKKQFGKEVTGFWPSEGSVSVKTLSLLAKNGIKWACTDEEIIFKTLKSGNKELVYKPYSLQTNHGKINLYFRDKYLSDLIGFQYSKKSATDAASDFVAHLKSIYFNSQESIVVPVILDGENAWEFFPNNAKDFFEELYKQLSTQNWCETVLYDDIPNIEDLKEVKLDTIASGSWISGNFDIWIGSNEKNRAWELLDMTKESFDNLKDSLDEPTLRKIEKEFLIALGSDWFWWYGDDHYTELNHQFDEQFRAHLKNIFELMKKSVPDAIFTPIVKKENKKRVHTPPKDFIHPVVDGNNSNFFEWLNSGEIDIKKEFSTMDSSASIVDILYYGKDRDSNLYLYFKGEKIKSKTNKDLVLRVTLNDMIFVFNLKKGVESLSQNGQYFDLAYDDGIELKIYSNRAQKVNFMFEIFENDRKIQRYPLYDEMILDFEDLFLKNWYV